MESFPFFPVTCSCHLFQKITAVTDSRGRCCTEWDDCFSCKVILFYKVIYWPCCNSPPDRELKCSQFPSCVDFTGFNCIQNCVYCYYLSFFSKIPYTLFFSFTIVIPCSNIQPFKSDIHFSGFLSPRLLILRFILLFKNFAI